MKIMSFKKPLKTINTTAMLVSLMMVSACGEAKDPTGPGNTGTPSTRLDITADEYLPFFIAFKTDGTPDIRAINQDGWSAKVVDVKDDEFPIQAKIKRVETMTFVTYEGSCNIIVPTPAGYKMIVIHNDAICAKIKP